MAEAKAVKKAAPKVRTGFLVYQIVDGALVVVDIVRGADRALELVDSTEGAKYHRFGMN